MRIAIWIIAICEAIRAIQNMIQIYSIKKDTSARDNAYAEFVKSLKYSDKEFVQRMLREFEEECYKEEVPSRPYVGEYIENPEELPEGTRVTLQQKDAKNWWENGEIYIKNGEKRITTYDSTYSLENCIWDVYLDSRYV